MKEINDIIRGFEENGYVTDPALATALFLMTKLRKPLLIEGHAGLGKTETANVLSSFLGAELIRLQCYEGLDINSAVYEWNYQKQLLTIKMQEATDLSIEEKEKHIFSSDFLLKRPLLQSITSKNSPPVLLIDEIDRADQEFEALLLELLSVYQITIPELGTIKAKHIPYVILTSNRTRELSDALKRRCLYHWIDYPDLEKELKIVKKKLPQIETTLANQIVKFVQVLRQMNLMKTPGVAETLDWAIALLALRKKELNGLTIEQTIGCLLKSTEDITALKNKGFDTVLMQALIK